MSFNVLLVEENIQHFHFKCKTVPVLCFMHGLREITPNMFKVSNG